MSVRGVSVSVWVSHRHRYSLVLLVGVFVLSLLRNEIVNLIVVVIVAGDAQAKEEPNAAIVTLTTSLLHFAFPFSFLPCLRDVCRQRGCCF